MIVDDANFFDKVRVVDEMRQGDVVAGRLRLSVLRQVQEKHKG